MSALVLGDALGPRGRRQARIATVVSLVAIGGLVVVAVRRLDAKGQLSGELWDPFTQWPVWKFLLLGLVNTLKVAALAMVFSVFVGGILALARLARSRLARFLATVYVEFFRGLPLLLLIAFCGFGLPASGVEISTFNALVLALTLYNAAVLAEVFRAGILSLDRGQSEAAFAIGLGYWRAMLLVVVPQAIRRMVPAIVSCLVTLLKDTSLGIVIAYEELLRRAQISAEFFDNAFPMFLVAAGMYIVVNYSLSRLARALEIRQRSRYQAGAIQVAGLEDLAVVSAQAEAALPTPEPGQPVASGAPTTR